MPTQSHWLSQAERIAALKGQVFFWRFMFWTVTIGLAGVLLCLPLIAPEVPR